MVDYETLAAALIPLGALLVGLFFRLGKVSNEQKNQSARLVAIEEDLKKLAPYSVMLEYLQRSLLSRGFDALPGSPETGEPGGAMPAPEEAEEEEDK